MFENTINEYSIKTCPSDDTERLEKLLNEMSAAGWDLYMLQESESKKGGMQYNCIFCREIEEPAEDESDIVNVGGNFKSKMEKMMNPSNEPYQGCKELQRRISDKQEEIVKIKKALDSGSENINRIGLNDEISKHLKELNDLKAQLVDIVDPIHMIERINQTKLSILISDELLELVEIEKQGDLVSETVNLRQKLTDELGYILPAIHFTDSDTLEANEYKIDIRGLKIASGFVYPGYRKFSIGESNIDKKPKDAIADIDPVTGNPGFWIQESRTKNFWENGLSPAEAIARHLEYIACHYVDEIMDYSDINSYIAIVGEQNLYLIENLIPESLSIGDLRYIFSRLIREKVSVKDIVYIFERLNDFVQDTADREIILTKLRIVLKRQICSSIADPNNNIYGIFISDNLADYLADLLEEENEESFPAPDEPKVKKLIKDVVNTVKSMEYDIANTAIIAPSYVRKPLFLLFEEIIPGLTVLSRDELASGINLEVIKKL